MNSEIKIWAVDTSKRTADELKSIESLESEKNLEDLFANNPEILMPRLTLVARQARAGKARVEEGELDLLGIDEYGKLVVFELKRKELARNAVAQIIDYCSYLESLTEDELIDYISKSSGQGSIKKEFEDFKSWYTERGWELENDLKPVKMVLVAFDADDAAFRMVEFLSECGVAISIQTFQGFDLGKQTFLASQLDRAIEERIGRGRKKQSLGERRRALNHRAIEMGIGDFWLDMVESLNFASYNYPTQSGITFSQPKIKLRQSRWNFWSSHSIVLESEGTIRVTFFPIAVHLCLEKFGNIEKEITSKFEKPVNAEKTNRASEQWSCILDQSSWLSHKDALMDLAKQVQDAWLFFEAKPDEGAP